MFFVANRACRGARGSATGGQTMADASRPRDMRKKDRSIYANLLVDAVRRHALLPSELVDKRLR